MPVDSAPEPVNLYTAYCAVVIAFLEDHALLLFPVSLSETSYDLVIVRKDFRYPLQVFLCDRNRVWPFFLSYTMFLKCVV